MDHRTLVFTIILLFFLSFGPFPDVILGKLAETEVSCTKSVEPSLLPVPLIEVFELTRYVETSNEDPTPYVYTAPIIP